jgi:hypothetical protein
MKIEFKGAHELFSKNTERVSIKFGNGMWGPYYKLLYIFNLYLCLSSITSTVHATQIGL